MLNMLGNLTKAVVSVAVTPITVVADVVMMPVDASDGDKPMLSRTTAMLENAGECTKQALKPEK